MRRLPPGFGPTGGLGLSHNPLDINAGVTTSHLRLARERIAARLAAAATEIAPKVVEGAKPQKGAGK